MGAAQGLLTKLTQSGWGAHPLQAIGATGSGREIVGSLLLNCYGPEQVFVLNEIAAHAEGALYYDARVDTIFEIGGQDAKYIRLAEARVVDAAMNEACSAGTGSFIEEQGCRFSGVEDVVHLGQIAISAEAGVSLGQHCSVFMAEIIDEAAAGGVAQPQIIAGIYDSIIQNYLNRVKGNRSVGDVIFCQGMPFASDALAAAVARRTAAEVIVPPHPGTIGALGIARLTRRERPTVDAAPLSPQRFLAAEVLRKDHFVCKSVQGCGGAGNKCRIERIATPVDPEVIDNFVFEVRHHYARRLARGAHLEAPVRRAGLRRAVELSREIARGFPRLATMPKAARLVRWSRGKFGAASVPPRPQT